MTLMLLHSVYKTERHKTESWPSMRLLVFVRLTTANKERDLQLRIIRLAQGTTVSQPLQNTTTTTTIRPRCPPVQSLKA